LIEPIVVALKGRPRRIHKESGETQEYEERLGPPGVTAHGFTKRAGLRQDIRARHSGTSFNFEPEKSACFHTGRDSPFQAHCEVRLRQNSGETHICETPHSLLVTKRPSNSWGIYAVEPASHLHNAWTTAL
jgi:galactose mutarotase-like enzyme